MITKLKKIFKIKEKNKTNNFKCVVPIFQLFVHSNGELSFCSTSSVKNKENALFGNLSDFSGLDFLNFPFLKFYRDIIQKNNYQNCKFPICYSRTNFYMYVFMHFLKTRMQKNNLKKPQVVILGEDMQFFDDCENGETPKILLDIELREKTLSLLNNVKELVVSFKTELFYNKEICNFIKEVTYKFPEIKFSIVSNGILFDKTHCDELGITDRLSNVCIMLNSASSRTYKNCNFSILMKNLNWLSSLKQTNNLDNIFLSFCVDENNYEEMPLFLEIAKMNNAFALFRKLQGDYDIKNDLKNPNFIFSPLNKDYPKFVDVLSSQEFNTKESALDSFFNLISDKY